MIYILQNLVKFNAAYGGNFISSILTLEKDMKESGMEMIYLFSESASDREYVRSISDSGAKVYYAVPSLLEALERIMNEHPFSIIHSHFAFVDEYREINMFLKKNHGVKTVFHHHDPTFWPYEDHGYGKILETLRKMKAAVARDISKRIIFSDANIACGPDVLENLKKNRFRNLYLAENAVDYSRLDSYQILNRSDYTEEKYSKFILLAFGYDFYNKGIDLAIKAVQDLADRYSITLCLVMAARKEQGEEKIKKITGTVPPWLKILPPRQDVASYYHMADIFLSPSRSEGMSYAVMECPYCKCNMIVSDSPGQRHVLNVPGVKVIENGNVDMLKEKIIETLLEDNPYKEQAAAYVTEKFGLHTWCWKIISVYEELLK